MNAKKLKAEEEYILGEGDGQQIVCPRCREVPEAATSPDGLLRVEVEGIEQFWCLPCCEEGATRNSPRDDHYTADE